MQSCCSNLEEDGVVEMLRTLSLRGVFSSSGSNEELLNSPAASWCLPPERVLLLETMMGLAVPEPHIQMTKTMANAPAHPTMYE
mmetsp:Transcript_52133/g.121267  ORF Transcript_52133/g.121267 Transcript_52133/m.121267 type:complete len:84 (+) Transcript_52133:513-764(+)